MADQTKADAPSGGAGGDTKPSSKKKSSRRAAPSYGEVVADAKQLLAKARRHLKGFVIVSSTKSRSQGHITIILTAVILNKYETLIVRTAAAVAGQPTRKSGKKGATRSEAALRAIVYEAVTNIRGDVVLAADEIPRDANGDRIELSAEEIAFRKSVKEAFGSGAKWQPNSTPRLIQASETIELAWKNADFKAFAKGAGVTQARINAMVQAASDLSNADTTQSTAIGTQKSGTQDAKKLVRELKLFTLEIRRKAKRAFKKNPKVLAELMSTVARRPAKSRSKRT